uniref:Neuromodulin n=1 Tax=Myotis myotis TaxID=51298 RepID=A0A7J7ZVM3_MYOMY|nr:growth associated protein 43 [Myotis myotis]
MLCCMRRTKQVEKNDEDQKIEQDGIKPEDKAHKAATKIQASFRGHITRKKLKGEKKGDAQAAEAEMNEKKDDAPVADGAEKKEGESAAKASTDNSPSSKAEDAPAKEEPKQADVPAAVTAAAATTPAAEDAATKATTQPPTEASEGSQAEDKIEAADETKPKESARQDEGKGEELEADQEHA